MSSLTFRNVTFDVYNINNIPYITSTRLAQALGYANGNAVTKIYNRNWDEFSRSMTYLPKSGESKNRLFSLRGAHLVAMFCRMPAGKEFRRWLLDVLDKEARADVDHLRLPGWDKITSCRSIIDMDALADEAFSQIISLADAAETWLNDPKVKLRLEDIFNLLRVIQEKAEYTLSDIHTLAEEIGFPYVNEERERRLKNRVNNCCRPKSGLQTSLPGLNSPTQ